MDRRVPPSLLSLVLSAVTAFVAIPAPAQPAAEDSPTWAEHVAPIVFRHCTSCHRPGGGSPFDLTTHEEARRRGRLLSMVVQDGFMPPYPPGGDSPAYSNLRPMTEEETELLTRWVASGTPPGDLDQAPPLPDFEGWVLGEPDLVLDGDPIEIALDAVDRAHNFVMPIPLDEPRWVRAIALSPVGARPQRALAWIVDADRAASIVADDADSVASIADDADGLGFAPPPRFGGEALGLPPTAYPDGVARRVESGDALILQTVHQGTGQAVTAQPRVGLYFADAPPERRLLTVPLGDGSPEIPAGETTTVQSAFELPVAARIEGVLPIAHRLATRVRAWIELPDGTERTLIEIGEWDPAWLSSYWLAEPIEVPAGAALAAELVYDNTESNFRQIHFPPRAAGWGLSPADELAAVNVMLTVDGDDEPRLQRAWSERADR